MLGFKKYLNESPTETPEPIALEFLDAANNWRRVQTGVYNSGQMIAFALNAAKKIYPTHRIRAVGQKTGKFYDMVV
jgi:hypothetical protein